MKIKWVNVAIFVVVLAIIGILLGFIGTKLITKQDSPTTVEEQKTEVKIDQREESKRIEQIVRKFFESNSEWEPGESGRKRADKEAREWKVEPDTDNLDSAVNQVVEYMRNNKLVVGEPLVNKEARETVVEIGYLDNGTLIVTDKFIFTGLATVKKKEEPKKGKGNLAIIVDDAGASVDVLKRMLELDTKLTFAIIPNLNASRDSLNMIQSSGQQAILHLPMQPLDVSQAQPGHISVSMSNADISAAVTRFLGTLPGVVGVNNHQGSRATADERVMRATLQPIKAQGLFFVDSFTNTASIAQQTARKMGVPTARNNGFMDNDSNVASIKTRFRQAGQVALKNGSNIVICHVRPNTATALREVLPELKDMGITTVYISEMVN